MLREPIHLGLVRALPLLRGGYALILIHFVLSRAWRDTPQEQGYPMVCSVCDIGVSAPTALSCCSLVLLGPGVLLGDRTHSVEEAVTLAENRDETLHGLPGGAILS